MPTDPRPRPPSIMFYCHDTYGLGHLRRTLTLANHLRACHPEMSQLIVTGSTVAGSFPYPPGADYVKLPSVVKTGAGAYEARSIASSIDQVVEMRREMLLSAARHFRPDVFIVDHAPAGLKNEAVATLRWLRAHAPATKLVVGLRDIVDEPARVRRDWARDGIYPLLDDVYDRILVYGQPDIFNVVAKYGLSPSAAAKTRYVGYLGRPPGDRSPRDVRDGLALATGKLVVVTAGGGGDGGQLFRSVLDALWQRPDPVTFDCLLVAGPLMPKPERAELRRRASGLAAVQVLDVADDMASYLRAADAAVSMGGYNTVCELLSLGRPTLIVPRVEPRREQAIRAEALAARGLIRMLLPDRISPHRLLAEIDGMLGASSRPATGLAMNGLGGVAREIADLLADPATFPIVNPFHHAAPRWRIGTSD